MPEENWTYQTPLLLNCLTGTVFFQELFNGINTGALSSVPCRDREYLEWFTVRVIYRYFYPMNTSLMHCVVFFANVFRDGQAAWTEGEQQQQNRILTSALFQVGGEAVCCVTYRYKWRSLKFKQEVGSITAKESKKKKRGFSFKIHSWFP